VFPEDENTDSAVEVKLEFDPSAKPQESIVMDAAPTEVEVKPEESLEVQA